MNSAAPPAAVGRDGMNCPSTAAPAHPQARLELVRRFIEERISVEDRGHATPCWIWTRTLTQKGYGRGSIAGTPNVFAHRASYEAYVGRVPGGLQIDHLCRVTSCCNPAHLEVVTQDENAARKSAAKTHCVNGHEFTPENTRQTRTKGRACKTCAWLRDVHRRFRKRSLSIMADVQNVPEEARISGSQGVGCPHHIESNN